MVGKEEEETLDDDEKLEDEKLLLVLIIFKDVITIYCWTETHRFPLLLMTAGTYQPRPHPV